VIANQFGKKLHEDNRVLNAQLPVGIEAREYGCVRELAER
jgi:hypothetical protein